MMEGSPDENLDYSWYLDSGCTEHMTSMDVYGALHHQEGKVTSIGGVTLNCHTPAGPRDIAFKEVLLVPSLRKNLLSVKRICEKGGKVHEGPGPDQSRWGDCNGGFPIGRE